MKEAALFAWDQLLTEFAEIGLKINSGTAAKLLNYVAAAISTEGEGSINLYFLLKGLALTLNRKSTPPSKRLLPSRHTYKVEPRNCGLTSRRTYCANIAWCSE